MSLTAAAAETACSLSSCSLFTTANVLSSYFNFLPQSRNIRPVSTGPWVWKWVCLSVCLWHSLWLPALRDPRCSTSGDWKWMDVVSFRQMRKHILLLCNYLWSTRAYLNGFSAWWHIMSRCGCEIKWKKMTCHIPSHSSLEEKVEDCVMQREWKIIRSW